MHDFGSVPVAALVHLHLRTSQSFESSEVLPTQGSRVSDVKGPESEIASRNALESKSESLRKQKRAAVLGSIVLSDSGMELVLKESTRLTAE